MIEKFLAYKVTPTNIRARRLSDNKIFILRRKSSFMKIGELYTIDFDIQKEWDYKNHQYISGEVIKSEFIESNISIDGLDYESSGIWNPYEMFGDDAKEFFSDYINEGFRESFCFHDYSGYGFYEKDEDPVSDAWDYSDMGDIKKTYTILTKLLEDYPQCIDALVHIGHIHFDSKYKLEIAYHNYHTAILIAEKKFTSKIYDGIFLWSNLDNRPYLRALHGKCLASWKLENFSEALILAKQLYRMNPPDNLGARFLIEKIENKVKWEDCDDL